MGTRDIKAWLVLIFFLIAFLAGSGITDGARDLGMTGGEVYNPQTFLGGILGPGPGQGPGPWGVGWPFTGFGGWGGGPCCCGVPGWLWGSHRAELGGPKDETQGGARYGKFPAYYGGATGQTP